MIRWFIHNKVAANLLMVAIILGGLWSILQRITYEVFPSVEAEVVVISVAYPGASPEQMDRLIVEPIQQAVKDLENLKRTTGAAYESTGHVYVELQRGADKDKVKEEVEKKVDAMTTLPVEAEDPEIYIPAFSRRAIRIFFAGDLPQSQVVAYAKSFQRKLENLPDVSQVSLNGVPAREFRVEADPFLLRKHELTLNELASIIHGQTQNRSLGSVDTARGRLLLKSDSELRTASAYTNVPIKTLADGAVLRLGDIATVIDSYEQVETQVTIDGHPAIFFDVYQVEDANILDLSKITKALVEEEATKLPEGLALKVLDDRSEIFKSRLNTLLRNGIQGGFLVMLALALLLRLRYAFWVAFGIPVTFLGGFAMMPVFDISLNMITMFGYILVLGIVVDDAIVTAENVFVHYRRHGDQARAAIEGTEEIALPVTFGVLTTMAAMFPFFMITGTMGSIFSYLAAVVIIVLLFSLIESKLILPAHLAHISEKPAFFVDLFDKVVGLISMMFEKIVLWVYRPLLRFSLANIGVTLGFYLCALIMIVGLVVGQKVPFRFFPDVPDDEIALSLTMPTGTPYARTLSVINRIELATETLKEKYADDAIDGFVREISVEVDSNSPDEGRVNFRLAPQEARLKEISNEALLADWQAEIGVIPGIEKMSFDTQAFVGGGSDIEIALIGENIETLKAAGDEIRAKMLSYDGVIELNNSLAAGRVEIDMQLTKVAQAQGISLDTVTQQVRAAIDGATVRTLLLGNDEVEVNLQYYNDSYDSIAQLETLLIKLPTGYVPLSTIVDMHETQGPANLTRQNGNLLAEVNGDINNEIVQNSAMQEALQKEAKAILQNYPDVELNKSFAKEEEEGTNRSILAGAAAAGLMIYILLAIPFRSYGKPFIVMSIVPFGLAGAVLGHYVYGVSLYMPSMLGMLALLGILVNDSLVMVDYINKEYSEGVPLNKAVLEAGVKRFRPIFLTTLTTMAGVMPLLNETSLQAEFLKPMAISMGYGIFFGTLVTLFLVPVNYILYERLKPIIKPILRLALAPIIGFILIASLLTLGYDEQLRAFIEPFLEALKLTGQEMSISTADAPN